MSKIIRTRKPSVLPYYAAALVFVVLCAVLPVYRLWALAAALAAAAAAFLAAKKVCPPRVVETEVPFHTGVEDVDAMLADIQQKLDTLHSLNESLPEMCIRDRCLAGGAGDRGRRRRLCRLAQKAEKVRAASPSCTKFKIFGKRG